MATRIVQQSAAPANWADLSPVIRARLAAENIVSAEEWRALSRKRRASLFGIVPSVVRSLNRDHRGAPVSIAQWAGRYIERFNFAFVPLDGKRPLGEAWNADENLIRTAAGRTRLLDAPPTPEHWRVP